MTSFSVDGISTQRIRFGGPSRELFPSVESIEEFKVSSASNNAEFMQVSDLTTTTKSGTNQLRGTDVLVLPGQRMSAVDQFAPRDAAGKPIKPEIRVERLRRLGRRAGGAQPDVLLRDFRGCAASERGHACRRWCRPTRGASGNLSSVSTPIRNPFTGGSVSPTIRFP